LHPEVKKIKVKQKIDERRGNNDRGEGEYLHEANLSLLKIGRCTFGSKRGRKPPQLCHVIDHGHLNCMLGGEEQSFPFRRAMS